MTNYFKQDPNYQVSEVKRIKEMFETGALSRREFMQGLLAVGITAATATTIIAGSRDAMAMTPKYGGLVRMAYDQHGPDDSLDPVLWKETLGYVRGRCTYNNLLQFNDDLTLRPELARAWEANDSATEFTFELERGVTFHDGKELTADDVIYSMNRHMGENSVSTAKSLVTMIREWKKIDKYTVKAVLDTPNSDLPAIIATFYFKVVQDGAEEKEGYFNKGIGTGPFVVEEFKPGIICRSKKNPNYFREGRPYLDEIHTFGIGDSVARVNALQSGEIEIAAVVHPNSIPQIEAADNAELFIVESGSFAPWVCMLDRHPGNNRDFVLAMKHLMPRKRLVRKVLKGYGYVGNDQPISKVYSDHCEALAQRYQDLDKAKFHLKKSGITEAEVNTADVATGAIDLCLFAQAEAVKIGLTLNIKRNPADGYWGAVWGNKPMFISSWAQRPTANVMLTLAFHSEAKYNGSRYQNPRIDQLLVETRAETDPTKRQEMYCEIQTLIHNESGAIIPYHKSNVDAISTKVRGMPRVPLTSVGGAEWPEFVWLDS